ncbi:MAG: glycosyltransferase, partial [Methylococcaceae bacterium]|nr:glycosyltransferase [Methylococcaceae bacterium]
MNTPVSVVIVNYNGGPLLAECVRSVLASTVPVEVWVSDNASTDGSLIDLRLACGADQRLRIIEHPVNLGFARANNRALARTRYAFILFLNPDCLVQTDTLA